MVILQPDEKFLPNRDALLWAVLACHVKQRSCTYETMPPGFNVLSTWHDRSRDAVSLCQKMQLHTHMLTHMTCQTQLLCRGSINNHCSRSVS